MNKSSGKIAYLDGVRGVAALFVFFHHFLLAFYRAYYKLEPQIGHLPDQLEIRFGQSIFSVFANGTFYVAIFFVLSGFVLSRKYFQTGDTEVIRSGAHRRFLRLYIPVAVAVILSFCLMQAGLYYNVAASKITLSSWLGTLWTFPDAVPELWHSLTIGTMFQADASFDNSIWSITNELFGSLFVFAFLALTHRVRKRLFMIVLLLVLFFLLGYAAYIPFLLGISLNYAEKWGASINKYLVHVVAVVLLAMALVLGSFPPKGALENTLFEHWPVVLLMYSDWFLTCGAYFFVLSFVLSPFLQKVISMRFFRFLGYISFAFYLLHPLVIGSFSCFAFLQLYGRVGYNGSVLVVFFMTMAVCFVLSWLMAKYIDGPGVNFSRYVYERWIKPGKRVEGMMSNNS